MFAPIYNAVNTLLARLTSGRATKLDNLDAAITTRAAASDYTSGRATKLDNLDAAITSRSSHSAADVWSAGTRTLTAVPSPVNSIQTGKVDTSTVSTNPSGDEEVTLDVSISSVNTAKCLVLTDMVRGGISSTDATAALENARAGDGSSYCRTVRGYLTSSTNLRLYFGGKSSYNALSGRWRVVEFN